VPVSAAALELLRCPQCGCPLTASGGAAVCRGAETHPIPVEGGFLTLARPPLGKYDPSYAARYAALWAYGHQTLHGGLDEPLYRTVSSLVAESLAAHGLASGRGGAAPVIVDAGCGVGRAASDAAALAPGGVVLGIDGSPAMLELAERITGGTEPVEVELAEYGFACLEIPARGVPNLELVRGDLEDLPVRDGVADVALCVNTIDRLPHGPERAVAECARILKPGGRMVFTNPLNWTEGELWRRWPDAASILEVFEHSGLTVETWFDDLRYRELLDARGSFEEFVTLVVAARKGA
jgi:SAM-dependent methyltransferase